MVVRSTVEGYARFSPGTSKWTKHTIAEHVSIGGNGSVLVGTPSQVADGLETWIREADVDGFNFVSHPSTDHRLGQMSGVCNLSSIIQGYHRFPAP